MPITYVILSVVGAMFLIVGGDAAGTLLTAQGFSPFFIAWTRFAMAAVLLFPVSGMLRTEWRLLIDWRLFVRAALIAGGISFILTALRTEPMANVFAAFFIGPIVAYVLSTVLLGERVSVVRSVLLAISFVGVLIVVRPGFGFTAGMGFAVLAGCLHGSYLVATRWLAPQFRPRFLLQSQLMIGAVLMLPAAAIEVPEIGSAAIWLLAISALGSALGNLLLVIVNRTTPASVVAPLIYSQLVAATFYGFTIFGDWPDAMTLLGLAVILLTGVASALASRWGR